ncbi:MAG: hypothetical protein BGN92_12995 [Sphingobacteriales bacterium 41-5]|nr:MAG: hypothetical protein BGN92_12995 [Sphingobacteriales bacterium 41-5]
MVFAFSHQKGAPAHETAAALATLHFKYTPPSTNDYSPSSVASGLNWLQIPSNQACTQETDEVACSFSINVPTGDESEFVNGSGQPTSRVQIQPSSGSDAYVMDVVDATSNASVKNAIANVYLP